MTVSILEGNILYHRSPLIKLKHFFINFYNVYALQISLTFYLIIILLMIICKLRHHQMSCCSASLICYSKQYVYGQKVIKRLLYNIMHYVLTFTYIAKIEILNLTFSADHKPMTGETIFCSFRKGGFLRSVRHSLICSPLCLLCRGSWIRTHPSWSRRSSSDARANQK